MRLVGPPGSGQAALQAPDVGSSLSVESRRAADKPSPAPPIVAVASRNSSTRKWSERWLRRGGYEVRSAPDAAGLFKSVGVSPPIVALVDASLRDDKGDSICEALRRMPGLEDLPIVAICSGRKDIHRALEWGATEVVRKPLNWRLVCRRVDLLARMYGSLGELAHARDELERARRSVDDAESRLRFNGSRDQLTELPNRPRFESLIERALNSAGAENELAVLYLDLDRFKAINEIVGRRAADQILRQVAGRLQNCIRRSDLVVRRGGGVGTAAVARLSGDEFTILLTHVQSEAEVQNAAQDLLASLAEPFAAEDREVFLSATLGVALSHGAHENGELLLQRAELAMCEAKRRGGGMARFFEQSMEPFTAQSAEIHSMLREALDNGDLTLHYQPLVNSDDGRVVGAEALLRWQHAELGWLPPADFLPAAKGTDLMLAVGEWVLRTACRQTVAWRALGLPPVRIAVNISSCQLRRSNLAALVEEVLADTGLNPKLLELELSEQGVLHHEAEVLRQLQRIKALGVRLSVDDFGTGNSAIGYLKKFPLDVLKIDRSYVAGLAGCGGDAGIASAMVKMAHSLDLAVVAEGVEEEEQSQLLRGWGCDELQGFLFSPAVREEEFRQILESGFGSLDAPATREGGSPPSAPKGVLT